MYGDDVEEILQLSAIVKLYRLERRAFIHGSKTSNIGGGRGRGERQPYKGSGISQLKEHSIVISKTCWEPERKVVFDGERNRGKRERIMDEGKS